MMRCVRDAISQVCVIHERARQSEKIGASRSSNMDRGSKVSARRLPQTSVCDESSGGNMQISAGADVVAVKKYKGTRKSKPVTVLLP